MNNCKKTLGYIFILFVLVNSILLSQEFPYGVWLDKGDVLDTVVYNAVRDLGMNTVIQYADGENAAQKNILNDFNLIAVKGDSPLDAVSHYSSGYYTKWEAEDVVTNTLQTGIKANFGYRAILNSENCWTSGDSIVNFNTIMLTGPDYRQDKKYKPQYIFDQLFYTLRVTAGVKSIIGISPQPTDPVCKIEVVFRYYENGVLQEFHFPDANTILYVNTFMGETFETVELTYNYPPDYDQYETKMSGLNQYENLDYDDTKPGTGIQFRVTWYGNKQLYIDKFEVFDQQIGIDFVNNPARVDSAIFNFVNKYQGWDNINHFFNISEPQTIDNYTPMKIVDEILQSLGKPKGIAEFYPQYNGWRNGDRTIYKFKEMANPEKTMMEFITFVDGKPMEEMYEYQRDVLQEISAIDTGFWYESLIAEPTLPDDSNCWLYMPTPEKLNASLMLSLAHGAKGIIFWKLAPGAEAQEINCTDQTVWYNVILNRNYDPNEIIYNYLKNNFGNRLRGNLGKTLLDLNYTGNYLQLQHFTQTQNPLPSPQTFEYFTFGSQATNHDMNWHVGFLEDAAKFDNKYFLMANLWTNSTKSIEVTITQPVPGYINYRFRNIEPENNFDITFNAQATPTLTFPAGEGYLFQVAPVVKYGGKLVYNDTIKTNTTLIDNMTIASGKVLQINSGKYYTLADTVNFENATSFITGDGYLDRSSGGWIIIKSWDKSVFKGKEGSHPKIIWSKHPDISNVIEYKIYRNYASEGWQFLTSKNGNIFEFVDSSIIIIEGYPQANEVSNRVQSNCNLQA